MTGSLSSVAPGFHAKDRLVCVLASTTSSVLAQSGGIVSSKREGSHSIDSIDTRSSGSLSSISLDCSS